MSRTILCSIIACALVLAACQQNQSGQSQEQQNEETQTAEETTPQETFRSIDASEVANLNTTISSRGLTTAEGIMNAYVPKEEAAEGNYSYTLSEKALDQNTVEVTLREEGRMDDSIEGRKVVMVLAKNGGQYQVQSIKENYRCRQGRGHQEWSAEFCN